MLIRLLPQWENDEFKICMRKRYLKILRSLFSTLFLLAPTSIKGKEGKKAGRKGESKDEKEEELRG